MTLKKSSVFNDFFISLCIYFFRKKLRSGLSTESFLAFCDFDYSKFLNSLLTFLLKYQLKYDNRQKETQLDKVCKVCTISFERPEASP